MMRNENNANEINVIRNQPSITKADKIRKCESIGFRSYNDGISRECSSASANSHDVAGFDEIISSAIDWVGTKASGKHEMLSNTDKIMSRPLSSSRSNGTESSNSISGNKNDVAPPRSIWTPSQDEKLISVVEEEERETNEPVRNWVKVSNVLATRYGVAGRTAKQCRERWHNHLNPNVRKGPWSEEELFILHEGVRRFGQSWSSISCLLPGRTDNNIKNKYYCEMRKKQTRKSMMLSSLATSNSSLSLFPASSLSATQTNSRSSDISAPRPINDQENEFFSHNTVALKRAKHYHQKQKKDFHIDMSLLEADLSDTKTSLLGFPSFNLHTPSKSGESDCFDLTYVPQSITPQARYKRSLDMIIDLDDKSQSPFADGMDISHSSLYGNDIKNQDPNVFSSDDSITLSDIPRLECLSFDSNMDAFDCFADGSSFNGLEKSICDDDLETMKNKLSSSPSHPVGNFSDSFNYEIDNIISQEVVKILDQEVKVPNNGRNPQLFEEPEAATLDSLNFEQDISDPCESLLFIDPWMINTNLESL